MNTVRRIVKHPFFVTSIIVFTLILFLPFPFPEYQMASSFKALNSSRFHRLYADFDNDNISEFIRYHSGAFTGKGSSFIISKADGSIIFKDVFEKRFGSVSTEDDILFEDLFDTGIKSAAFFTHNRDTAFMFVFSLIDSSYAAYGFPFKTNSSESSSQIKWLGTRKNANKEVLLYFWIDDSESSNTSNIICFNLNSQQSKSYVFNSMYPQVELVRSDDSMLAIVVNTISNKNISDDLAWEFATEACKLIMLDADLELLNDPLILADSYGYADIEVIENDMTHSPEIFAFLWRFGLEDENGKLLKLDFNNTILFAENIKVSDVVDELLVVDDYKKELYLKTTSKEYWQVNKQNGSISKPISSHLSLDGYDYIKAIQLDHDPDLEHILFNSVSNEIVVMRKGFKKPSSFVVLDDNLSFEKFSARSGETFSMVIPGGTYINRITYKSTIWIWLKYPLWLAILLFLNLLVWFRSQLRKKKELELLAIERKITDLQLQNFRNQLDPHFTFNALNVIGSVIYKEDKDVAYDYFTRFSRLMRSSLLDSTKITRELDAEMQFTVDYLEFQKFRFKDKFDYLIDVDPRIDKSMQLPKMLIQGYTENAVRHGFYNVAYKGLITIKLEKVPTGTRISISDNGIGRKAAQELNTSTGSGRGMNVMEEQINLFNKYNSTHMSIKIVDLEEEGKAMGTSIEIHIPQNFSFIISRASKL